MESGTVLGGRYELTAKVGSGSVGSVWRATDRVLGRVVAVKVLHPELAHDDTVVRRFAAEARIMARLHHPGIAGLYDFGRDRDGTAYLVMAFIEGQSLRRLVGSGRTLPPARVMDLVAQAADALRTAHRAGVVHRDVKPVNLIVRMNGDVVLTDFGIARVPGNDLTGPGMVLGTAKYIAPEQAAGRQVTPAVDVYALGVTAYECLTGWPPFRGGTPMEVAQHHITSTPPPLPPTVPRSVRDLVMAMLTKDPARRPTAAQVAVAARLAARAPADARLASATSAGRRVPSPRSATPVDRRRRSALAGALAGGGLFLAMFAMVALAPVDPAGASRAGPNAPAATRYPGPAAGGATARVAEPPAGGRRPERVVDVVDRPEAEAVASLEARGFTVRVVPRPGPRCAVVAQDPPVGQVRPPGTTVTLTVERDARCAARG